MPSLPTCPTCNKSLNKVSVAPLEVNGGGTAKAFFCGDCNAILSIALTSQDNAAAPEAPADELSGKIDALVAETLRYWRPTNGPSAAVATVQRILAGMLGVQPGDIAREHVARFLRQMPDKDLLRYRGLGKVTIARARRELGA